MAFFALYRAYLYTFHSQSAEWSAMNDAVDPDLIAHLVSTSSLPASTCTRMALDVLAQYGETVEAFVLRRHAELMHEGLKNAQIYGRLIEEISARRFAAPTLTERQVRRMIYG